MISCTEFIPLYSEFFKYLEAHGGENAVMDYWIHISDTSIGDKTNPNSLASKFGDKIVIPMWENAVNRNMSFLVRLSLKGFDRIGIINDITRYISFVMSVNIRKFCISTDDGVFDGFIDLYVHDMGDLDKLMAKLQKIEGIQHVIRTDL